MAVCSHACEACGCETEPEHPFALSEEYVAGPTDSGGFSRPARSGLSGCAPRWENWPDAFVVIDRGINVPLWEAVARGVWDHKPRFVVESPNYVTAAVSEFVRSRLSVEPSR